MSDTARAEQAAKLLAALPASVEMPAGTGKTHLLVDVVQQIADEHTSSPSGRRPKVLVLTHTHAGVQAVRQRLGHALADVTDISTLSSFAFDVARSYPQLGGITVPEHPDWEQSAAYLQAGVRVCGSTHIRRVLAASYTHLLVDEYQDCSRPQHELIVSLSGCIPATAVFGDRLQGVFGFDRALPLVSWADVEASFSRYSVQHEPWRWHGHNRDLGTWLLSLRARLVPGTTLDLSDAETPSGMRFLPADPTNKALKNEVYRTRPPGESVLVLTGNAPAQTRKIASQVCRQGYSAMEDINGAFMREQLIELAATPVDGWACWLARLAKRCFTGYSKIDDTVMKRLAAKRPAAGLSRPGLAATVAALDVVAAAPSLTTLAAAMRGIDRAREASAHSSEAWRTVAAAIDGVPRDCDAAELRDELLRSLAALRDQLRHIGRPERHRQVSRTLLVKGLEYDHVIITDISALTDVCNLYVALTRARKTITIIGHSAHVALSATRGATI
ncbi:MULTISPECIES: UvrD-helicase domain-containing protein [Pseudonocardia]|uniref:ATP-dependent helicase/nuclease subunit A n=2 Tax=Pseudonocardia TaxID=1847 RepID=A0A1Y2MIL0_PSEAH|nr:MULTISPECIES: UvrD-helicase domain-containing protein [Pseudonocardia]OSY35090.1 ATP-dependent helicase/nuclease subunit A [Pseudonocardia autotrophica]TDN72109.1 AAA domain-containing protein [Pseudonocardia autotrophica]BBG02813.1 hypothetical protein Pdca_40220 [Pseudonocardia autotrophica]GEC26132.1 hypothetical protein PSA01_31610 [Pseudonocardia saturnea]